MLRASEPGVQAVLLLMLLMPLFSLRAAGWPLTLNIAVPALLLSLLCGTWLARSRHGELLALLLSQVYGLASVLLLVALNEPGDLLQGVTLVLRRVLVWVSDALAGSINQDVLILNLLLALLLWFLAYNAVWHVLRVDRVWRAVLPTGLVLVANAFAYQGTANLDIWLGGYLFLALLLVVRSSLETREWYWYLNRVRVPLKLRRQFYRLGAALALLTLLLAWLVPATEFQQRLDQFQELLAGEPITEVTQLLDRLFASGELPGPATADFYGSDALQLGGAVQPGAAEVMHVSAPPGRRYYWRSRVFDVYEAGRWLPAADTRLTDPQAPLTLPQNTAAGAREAVEQTFTMALRASRLVYAAPQVASVELPTRSDLRYIGPDGRFLEPPAGDQRIQAVNVSVIRPLRVLNRGDSYRVSSLMSRAGADQLRAAGRDWPEWVRSLYFYVSPSVTRRTRELALRIVSEAGAVTPYDQAKAIETWLRHNIRYNERIPQPPPNQDPVDWMLFDMGEGYCNYYASAMVVMLRSLGVPARLAAGFAQGTWDPAREHFVVLERDAHSWVEVYFPGHGWIEFEPTSAQAPLNHEDPQRQTIPPADALSTATPSATFAPEPSIATFTPEVALLPNDATPTSTPSFTPTPTFTPTPSPTVTPSLTPTGVTPPVTAPSPVIPPQNAPLDPPVPESPERSSALPESLPALLLLVLLLLLLLLFLWWWWEWRGLRRLNPVARAWARLERYTRLLGIRLQPSQTPAERRRRILRDLPVAEASVTTITNMYMRERYGPARRRGTDRGQAGISWGRARYRILRRWLGRLLRPWRQHA